MSKIERLTTLEMEVAIAQYFGIRKNIIVPNVSFGLGIHECDMLILTPSLYATEIEIKRTCPDLIKDKEKSHGHRSNKIKTLFFAIPSYLEDCIEHIPDHAGVIIVYKKKGIIHCNIVRRAVTNTLARAFTQTEVNKLLQLGIMRMWRLKGKLNKLI